MRKTALFCLSAILVTSGSAASSKETADTAFLCKVQAVTKIGAKQIETQAPHNVIGIWYGLVPKEVGLPTDDDGAIVFVHDPSDIFPDEYSWRNELPESFSVIAPGEWTRVIRLVPATEGTSDTMRIVISSVKKASDSSANITGTMLGSCARRALSLDEFYSETHQ